MRVHAVCERCDEGEVDALCRQVTPYDYQHLFVDVDSCLCGIEKGKGLEGIVELARMCGKEEEVALLTQRAMDGEVAFNTVFGRRLEIVRPRRSDLAKISQLYLENLAPDAEASIQALQDLGVNVCLISGGYRGAILLVAERLGISWGDVYANELFFRGEKYFGFDESNPLTRTGGKREVIEKLRTTNRIWGPVAIVGDSVSELEAKPVVDLCIGFGGFVPRASVEEQADIFLPNPSFAPLLPIILNCHIEETIRCYPRHRRVMKRGLKMLKAAQFNHHAFRLGESLLGHARTLPLEMFEENYPVPPIWKGY